MVPYHACDLVRGRERVRVAVSDEGDDGQALGWEPAEQEHCLDLVRDLDAVSLELLTPLGKSSVP